MMRDTVKSVLEALLVEKPKGRVRRSELRDTLEANKATIEKALKQGHSKSYIAARLKDAGIGASVETIRVYIGDMITAPKKRTSPKPSTAVKPITG